MTRGLLGYGRYDDDPDHIGCPRAKSDMTPCIARDGDLAAEHRYIGRSACVGCGADPVQLLVELVREGSRCSDNTPGQDVAS